MDLWQVRHVKSSSGRAKAKAKGEGKPKASQPKGKATAKAKTLPSGKTESPKECLDPLSVHSDESSAEPSDSPESSDVSEYDPKVKIPEPVVDPTFSAPPGDGDDLFAAALDGSTRLKATAVAHLPGGRIAYYSSVQSFVAKCAFHTDCFCHRTSRGSKYKARAGQGRPLCRLISWLDDMPLALSEDTLANKLAHKDFSPCLEQRRAKRNVLATSSARALAKYERKLRKGEAAESAHIP